MPSLTVLIAILLIVGMGLIAIIALAKANKGKERKGIEEIRSKVPLTKNEQPMYFRLSETFPESIVLSQVAFSALLTTKDRATRNRFDRKVADFVICSKGFEVLAVIELDDSSHNGREKEDALRSSLLTNAGYKVLRYKKTPDTATLIKDLENKEATGGIK